MAATAPGGVELSVGLVRDPHLGPLVVVGAGGVLVELMADRAVRLPPTRRAGGPGPRSGRLSAAELLDGVRGGPPADLDAVSSALVALSMLAVELGEALDALEVNPLRCGPDGCWALDALIEARPRLARDQKIT